MRRGCISLVEIQCDQCQRMITHSERYLVVDDEDGVDGEKGKIACYCVECALEKGFAYYKEDKGERTLSFFPQPEF